MFKAIRLFFILFFGLFVFVDSFISLPVNAQTEPEPTASPAIDPCNRDSDPVKTEEKLTLTASKTTGASDAQNIFDGNGNNSISLGTDPVVLGVLFPTRVTVTKIRYKIIRQTGRSDTDSLDIYTGIGITIPDEAEVVAPNAKRQKECPTLKVDYDFGFVPADNYYTRTPSIGPTKADYLVIRKPKTDKGLSFKLYELEVYTRESTEPVVLKITTNLKSTDIGTSNVKLFDVTDNQKRDIGQTNDEGFLELKDVPKGKRIYQVDGEDEFKRELKDITLRGGENKLTFDIELLDENVISGTLTDTKKKPLAGVMVQAIGSDGGTASVDIADSKGTYKMTGLPADSYQIVVSPTIQHLSASVAAKAPPKTSTGLQTIGTTTIKKNRGGNHRINGKITPPKTKGVTFQFNAYNVTPGSFVEDYSKNKIKPEIIIYNTDNQYQQIKKPFKKFIAPNSITLSPGCYFIEAKLNLYTDITYDVFPSPRLLCTDWDGITNQDIYMISNNIPESLCRNVPQALWICHPRNAEIVNNPDYQNKFTEIASTIAELKKKYSIDAPLDIYIDSGGHMGSSNEYAGYFYNGGPIDSKKTSCPYSPNNNVTPRLGERIILNIEYLSLNVVVHEWGHTKSWRLGKCKGEASSLPNRFNVNFNILKTKYEKYIDEALYEENYKNNQGGYESIPDEQEAYAAAFSIGILSKKEFDVKVNSYPPEAKKRLKQMVDDALSPNLPPTK